MAILRAFEVLEALEVLSSLGRSAAIQPPTVLSCSRVVAGCFKDVSGRGSVSERETR
jgi:hypothetical protein